MNEIIPAILAVDEKDFASKLSEIPKEVKLVHIDVLDRDTWTKIARPFEAHIMAKDQAGLAELWVKRGAEKIIVHELNERIRSLRGRAKLGLAVELHTPLEKIFPLLSQIDFLHLMSIAKIGKQGRPLDEKIFDRIRSVKEKFPTLDISVDGGIKTENWERMKNSGATRFVVGSGFKDLWKSLTKN